MISLLKHLLYKSRWLNIIIAIALKVSVSITEQKNCSWASHPLYSIIKKIIISLLDSDIKKSIWTFIILSPYLPAGYSLSQEGRGSTFLHVYNLSTNKDLTAKQRRPGETTVLWSACDFVPHSGCTYFQWSSFLTVSWFEEMHCWFYCSRLFSFFLWDSDVPHGGLRYLITKQKLSRLAVARFMA